ncbi:hypothetical protein [Actinomycetospora sp. TBRC 11914]|uniref:hypothetical protein n=1 Tax=Actinomycetospora sp. TBRC 11914 TaxID=2729387 RepID=UPI00145F23BA|nr:hypothetical protein [Actinomycetospora sp. TBRC 11914]NMO90955.1 hypothetical protein [Actinomycetospora sp. TBRC 11914]
MVPEDWHEFFVATATVAGALIGLLFVAISVRPGAASRTAHITVRLRSVTALSAFLNTLFLSLLALRPRAELGSVSIALGAAGLASMVVMLVLLAGQGRDRPGRLAQGVVLVLGQGVLYGAQLWDGLRLLARPADVAVVDNLAIIVIVLFALGLARAWEFVGADNPSLLGAIARVAGGGRTDHGERSGDGGADRPAS